MRNLNTTAIAVAIGLVFSAGAMAQSLSRSDYEAEEARIADAYKSDKAECNSQSGNKKDICIAEAKGNEKIAKAELEARAEPSAKNDYNVLIAMADADYRVSKEKCNDQEANARDVCIKEAKAAETRAKAEAEVRMKTWKADKSAEETSAEASMQAKEDGIDARQDAAREIIDADYAVAIEKCDAMDGDVKARCVDAAKAKFNQ
ncbi:hypothetical protein Thiowin_03226 [Thiorhodovibrio winogradskyi]|uniref:Cell envelope biogenesis protein TolA n=1 Tax=Thiorhodovibrio winogradskyi TaxID=77007 RepID=A0ABZ0SBA6_9GAMM|nr:hypothetical protein [Thiorhodovibrio winogradskyi]